MDHSIGRPYVLTLAGSASAFREAHRATACPSLPDEDLFCVRIDSRRQNVRLPSAVALGQQCRSVTVHVAQPRSETPLLETVVPVQDGASEEGCLALGLPAGYYETQFTRTGGSEPMNPWGGPHCGYKGPYRNDWRTWARSSRRRRPPASTRPGARIVSRNMPRHLARERRCHSHGTSRPYGVRVLKMQ